MRRNSVVLPPKKDSAKAQKKHQFSTVLSADPRVKSAPRHLEVIHQTTAESGEVLFLVKVYGPLAPDAPGSELMTLSCVTKTQGVECEMRFDERFPVSIRFRAQTDTERAVYARDQIERSGGFTKLAELFRSSFPKLGV
ncbi:MAG: hypothetical protein HY075_11095 [Deltaproteobacteria bacterium]|nr:hypothetical protein [Deltaproteobacteria bacterium]